jgi:hypothetical protein
VERFRWCDLASDLEPAVVRSRHLFETPSWLAAWEKGQAERTLGRRYLLTGADPDGEDVLALYLTASTPFWTGYELDAGVGPLFSAPVIFAPSLYSFSPGPTRPTPVEVVRTCVDAVASQARAWEAEAFVIANLDASTARSWSLAAPPTSCIRLDLTFSAGLPTTLQEFLTFLNGDERTEMRRRWRRATERGVVLAEHSGWEMAPRLLEFLALANDAAVRHGIPPLYDIATFEALAVVPGARLFTAERNGQLLSGFLSFEHNRCLYLWSGGICYEALREFSPYVFLLYEVLGWAIERGLQRIEFGRGSYEFKGRHGFRPTELWSLVYASRAVEEAKLRERLGEMHAGLSRYMGLAG